MQKADSDKTVIALFEEQVKKTPQRIALVSDGLQLTYQALNARANQLAHYLQGRGVGPEKLVALQLERSPQAIIAILAVLKAGGAYLPLDRHDPIARWQFILKDSDSAFLITASHNALTQALDDAIDLIVLDEVEASLKKQDLSDPQHNTNLNHLAYVIYTSGSTGQPKGVEIEHKGLPNLASAQIDQFQMTEESRVLQFSALHFDALVSEIWTTFLSGAGLYLPSQTICSDPDALFSYIRQNDISVATIPPALLASTRGFSVDSLKTLVLAGDTCPQKIMDSWQEKCLLINAYGPTETTVCATMGIYDGKHNQCIGRALPNIQCYVLSEQQEEVAIGEVGELYVAGVSLARAYRNRPELTAEKFIDWKSKESATVLRVYKTGDWVRKLSDGRFDYIGRIDLQIKFNGIRIDPFEIEAVLNTYPRVQNSVVVLEKGSAGERLVACLAVNNDDVPELWPSTAEYFIYDNFLYDAMTFDDRRNQSYKAALKHFVKDKVVVDIGTGPEALLARFCVDLGAKKVYAIECLEEAFEKSNVVIQQLNLHSKIELLHGDATQVNLPEKVDVIVSEIVGAIGGSEGAAVILNDVKQRFLKSGGVMIPERSLTRVAAVELPSNIRDNPGFTEKAAQYVNKIFDECGGSFDLRLCIKDLPSSCLLSNSEIFEDLKFHSDSIVSLKNSHSIELNIRKAGNLDGLLVWLTLQTAGDECIDTLKDRHCWLPVYFPIFDNIKVHPGDRIEATCYRTLSSDQLHPDYFIVGSLNLQGRGSIAFEFDASHKPKTFKSNAFYSQLFKDNDAPILMSNQEESSSLKVKAIRNHLKKYLPYSRIPNAFAFLDKLPTLSTGKVDRLALPTLEFKKVSDGVFPLSNDEKSLRSLWSKVLQVEEDVIGSETDFFSLGGSSLSATQLAAAISAQQPIFISLADILEHPTLNAMAQRLCKLEKQKSMSYLTLQDRPALLPLSFAQRRLWLVYQMLRKQRPQTYNIKISLQCQGVLALTALQKSVQSLVNRHEILRTYFPEVGVQTVGQFNISLERLQLNSEAGELEPRLASVINELADHDFGDLSALPLMRAVLIEVAEHRQILCLVFHHIIVDGFSLPVLLRDLNAFYNHHAQGAALSLPELPIQYADFALWEEQRFEAGHYKKAFSYWQQQLRGASGALELPLDKPRPEQATYAGATHIFYAPKPLMELLQILAQQHEVTLFTVLLSSLSILLYRYNQQEDFILGVAHGERPDPSLNDLVGFFVNMLPIRIQQDRHFSVTQVLQQVHARLSEAYQNNAPIEAILEQLDLPQHAGSHPLFQVALAFHNMPLSDMDFSQMDVSLWESSLIETSNLTSAKFDISFEMALVADGRLAIKIEYAQDLFLPETIERMAQQWLTLCESLAQSPSTSIASLPLLSHEQQAERIVVWSRRTTDNEYSEQTMLSLFKEQVEQRSDAIAIVDGDVRLTYRELNEQANRLAHYLLKDDSGTMADRCIAITLNRSAAFIISALAVLKTGAAYLPLDPELPRRRLEFMLEDAQVEQLITNAANKHRFSNARAEIICLDDQEMQAVLSTQASTNLKTHVNPQHLAYVIYTSGSTGKAKGVMIEHRNVVQFVKKLSYLELGHRDVIAHVCSVTFDVSVFEIWGALLNGARVVVFSKSLLAEMIEFKNMLKREGITILGFSVPIFQRCLLFDASMFQTVKYLFFGGEKLIDTSILNRLFDKPAIAPKHLVNIYGPTENTVFSTCYSINFDQSIPDELLVGSPVGGTQIYVLDSQLQPVPEGVLGELYLGGSGLARGYLNRDTLTQESFISNLFVNDGSRLYRTGDMVRYQANGDLVFVKRIDQQVKLSGYRIELAGIEKVLLAQTNIKEALVLRQVVDGRPMLVAYVVPKAKRRDLRHFKQQLRTYLSELLPHYMLPSTFILLDVLPLSLNGKIDRHALPPVCIESDWEYVSPTTIVEKKLLTLWQSVFSSHRKMSIRDNFFLLGGNSLLAMQLTSLIYLEFGAISYSDLFKQPTIESQAQLIETPERQRITPTQHIDYFKQEAVLEDDIRLSVPWEEESYPRHPRTLFLTGVTGFLGAFLLDELLRTTDAKIYCLVRAKDSQYAKARLMESLCTYKLDVPQHYWSRIYIVLGDVEKPRFGLSMSEYDDLANRVEMIYHAASEVNFAKPYSALRGANVGGAKHILRFSIHQTTKPLHYISSAAVFSFAHYFKKTSILMEEELDWDLAYSQALPHDLGYVQSKAVAEKLVWQAISRGVPVAIHRPGFILCHSQTGLGSVEQMWARFLKDCLALGAFPQFSELKEEFVTVDYVAQATVCISRQVGCIGKAFHIVPELQQNITTDELFGLIQWKGRFLKAESLSSWCCRMQNYIKAGNSSALALLMPLFTDPVQDDLTLCEAYQYSPDYSNANTKAALKNSGIVCTPMSAAILKRYFGYLMGDKLHKDMELDLLNSRDEHE